MPLRRLEAFHLMALASFKVLSLLHPVIDWEGSIKKGLSDGENALSLCLKFTGQNLAHSQHRKRAGEWHSL